MRVHAQEAGDALDHYLAHVVLGLTDQRDASVRIFRRLRHRSCHTPHPFGAGPRFAGAAASKDQPGRPQLAGLRKLRRHLVPVRVGWEVVRPASHITERYSRKKLILLAGQ